MREKTASLAMFIVVAITASVVWGLFKGDTFTQVLPLVIGALVALIVFIVAIAGRRILNGKLVTKAEYEAHRRTNGGQEQ